LSWSVGVQFVYEITWTMQTKTCGVCLLFVDWPTCYELSECWCVECVACHQLCPDFLPVGREIWVSQHAWIGCAVPPVTGDVWMYLGRAHLQHEVQYKLLPSGAQARILWWYSQYGGWPSCRVGILGIVMSFLSKIGFSPMWQDWQWGMGSWGGGGGGGSCLDMKLTTPTLCAKVTNAWSCTFTFPCAFMACVLAYFVS